MAGTALARLFSRATKGPETAGAHAAEVLEVVVVGKRQADDSMGRPRDDLHRIHPVDVCWRRPTVVAEVGQARALATLLTDICHQARALQVEETVAAAKVGHTSPSAAACRLQHKGLDWDCVCRHRFLGKAASQAVWKEGKGLLETSAAKVSHSDQDTDRLRAMKDAVQEAEGATQVQEGQATAEACRALNGSWTGSCAVLVGRVWVSLQGPEGSQRALAPEACLCWLGSAAEQRSCPGRSGWAQCHCWPLGLAVVEPCLAQEEASWRLACR